MDNTLKFKDRRHARLSLIADLTAVFMIALGTFAWAEVNPAAAERTERTATIASVPAPAASEAPVSPASETWNDDGGCGCAEACLVAR